MKSNRPLRLCVIALVALIYRPSPVAAAACVDRSLWPTSGWTSRTEEFASRRAAEISALEEHAFTLTGTDGERKGPRTDAAIIVYQGSIIYERYARGFQPEMRHESWSVSKSVVNALAGLAVAQGLLSITESVCTYLTLPRTDHCDITAQNLLEFASGLAWSETYEGQSNQASSVLAMLYGEGRRDTVAFVAGHDSRNPPGATYMYSTGDATFLAGVVDHAMAQLGPDYPWTLLFDPLGMDSAVFERDAAGNLVGGSYFYATPRDMAKFGFLYLNDGCWEGTRLLPESWVHDSTQVSQPFRMRALGTEAGDAQGRQFWLNVDVPEQNITKAWPEVPGDAFAALGHWGQSIAIVPSRDVVVVRSADDRDKTFDYAKFLELALAVAQ